MVNMNTNLNKAPSEVILWAWIKTTRNEYFWALAIKDNDGSSSDHWVGIGAQIEHTNRCFDDYRWEVLGWKEVVQPDPPYPNVPVQLPTPCWS